MHDAIEDSVKNRSAWFVLVLMVGASIAAEVAAVRARDIGLAVAGLGFAFMGAFAFLVPISFTKDIRRMFRAGPNVDPRAAVLAGVGVLLNLVGVAMRWMA